jgi:hypothetical protein
VPPALVATSQCSRKVLDFRSVHNSCARGGPRNNLMGRVIDLHVADGDASPLIGVLSERGIPVIVTTGGTIDRGLLTQTVAVLQKPYSEADLIKVLAMVR